MKKYLVVILSLVVVFGCGKNSKIEAQTWAQGHTSNVQVLCEEAISIGGCGDTDNFARHCDDSLALEDVTSTVDLYSGKITLQPWSTGVDVFNIYNAQGEILENCETVIDNVNVGIPQYYSTIHNGVGYMIEWCERKWDETCPKDLEWRLIKSKDREKTPPKQVTKVVNVPENMGVDSDNDGYYTNGNPKDCDDSNPFIYPGANGYDEFCNPAWDGKLLKDYTYATVTFETTGTMYCWQGDNNGIEIDGEIPHRFGEECFPGKYILSPYGVHHNVVYGPIGSGIWEINNGTVSEYEVATKVWWTVGPVTCNVSQIQFVVPNVGVAGYNNAFFVSGDDTDKDGEFDAEVKFKNIDDLIICQ